MSIEKQEILRIDGKARVLDMLFDMIRNSKKEVIMTMRYWGSRWGDKRLFHEVIFPELKDAINHALSSGVTVKIMGDIGSDAFESSKSFREMGVEVKNLKAVYLRFVVVDEKKCLFAISEPYTETTHFYHAIVSSNEILVRFFKDYFESLWPVSEYVA